MASNIIKIWGIVLLSFIPNRVSEIKRDYAKEIKNPAIYFSDSKRNISKYENETKELEENINILDIKKDFFQNRLKDHNTNIERKIFYLNNLKEVNNELKKYHAIKDSLYKLIKD